MNRSCKKHRNNLVAYMDRELSENESAGMSAHLGSCQSCREELGQLHQAMNALPEWENIIPSEDYDRVFWEKVRLAKQEQEKREEKRGLFHIFRFSINQRFSLATSAALAACILVITFFSLRTQTEIPRHELQMVKNIDLFHNMEIIENREALENFEVIKMLDVLGQDLRE